LNNRSLGSISSICYGENKGLFLMEQFKIQILYRDYLLELVNRMPSSSESKVPVSQRYHRIKTGLSGEMKIFLHLKELILPYPFLYMTDFEVWDDLIQIDGLIITPYYIYVLEIKNISGILDFDDETEQFLREKSDGTKDGMKNPIKQVERNVKYLARRLNEIGIKLPLIHKVVFAYPSTIIRNKPLQKNVLIFGDQLVGNIESIKVNRDSHVEQQFENMVGCVRGLINSESKFPLCEKMKVPQQLIRKGVKCVDCGIYGMIKVKKGWVCSCGASDKYAHLAAFKSYRYIIGKEMTNQNCREFLLLHSEDVAYRLLKSLKCSTEGKTKNASYILDMD
jgi:hypothetical protein